MPKVLRPGNGIIFMKVGTHAQEPLEQIIARKRRELEDAGASFWGYGGNTCHPLTFVQPFAKQQSELGRGIHLVMKPMDSKHFAEPELADEYSDDGVTWKKIPAGIAVRGSRYALVLDSLDADEFDLDLRTLRVALGCSKGASGADYVKGQVDKGCFIVDPSAADSASPVPARIGLVARLKAPYAVLLR